MRIWEGLLLGLVVLIFLSLWLPLGAEVRLLAQWPRRLNLEGRLRLWGRWTLGRFDWPGPPGREKVGGQSLPLGPPPGWRLEKARVSVQVGLGDPAATAVVSGFLQALGAASRGLWPIKPELSVRPDWASAGFRVDAFLAWRLRLWNLLWFLVHEWESHRARSTGHPKVKPG